jgi:hypothetical protein
MSATTSLQGELDAAEKLLHEAPKFAVETEEYF